VEPGFLKFIKPSSLNLLGLTPTKFPVLGENVINLFLLMRSLSDAVAGALGVSVSKQVDFRGLSKAYCMFAFSTSAFSYSLLKEGFM